MRIGIFGGSFNPVHRAHLELAQYALEQLNLSKIFFVIAKQSPLKDSRELLPLDLRLEALKKALAPFRHFELSECEIRRRGPSYTIDTLRAFKKKTGADVRLYFICGADAALQFPRWKGHEEILKIARVVVVPRRGIHFPPGHPEFIYLPWKKCSVSSTKIRRRIRNKQSLAGELTGEGSSTCLSSQLVEKLRRSVKMSASKIGGSH